MSEIGLNDPIPEAQRHDMQNRCNAVTGNTSPILSEILCYFPEKAELFIKTQEYASNIKGKKGVWFSVEHKKKGYGLNGDKIYEAGQLELLDISGFTGQFLLNQIEEIQNFKCKEGLGVYITYLMKDEIIKQIIHVSTMLKEKINVREQMTAKLLETMKVTPEELKSLNDLLMK